MRTRQGKLLTLLAVVLVAALGLASCAGVGRRGIAAGWAGGVVVEDTLFVGSMEGRLIAMDGANGNFRGDPIALEMQVPSSSFGCSPGGTSPVAVYGSPAVAGDLVYVGGYNGKVYAYVWQGDRLRQDLRWVFPRQGDVGGPIIGGIVTRDGVVYFGAGNGAIYALDAADGFEIWHYEVADKIWAAPAVEGGIVFVGSFDKKLHAIDADDGSELWAFETGGTITSTPAVADGTVYFGSFDRTLYAVDAATGREKWRFPEAPDTADAEGPEGWFWTSPVVVDGVVYAPNLDGSVYARDARTGAMVARFDLGTPISAAPVAVNGLVIVATSTTNRAKTEGAIYSLDVATKEQRKLLELDENVYAPLFTDGTTVYAHTMADNLYAIDVATGASRKFALASGGE